MKQIFSYLKTSLVTVGVLTAAAVPSLAGPASMAGSTTPIANTAPAMPDLTPVRDRCTYNPCYGSGSRNFIGDSRYGKWNGERNWRRNGNWNNGGNWDNDNWRWRNRHHRRHNDGAGFALGLGLGLGSSYLYNNYNYNNYTYQPRRIYRSEGNAHVRWCYNRYRSYRAWDNTFQPYNGPRQQCYSPYD